MPFIPHTDEEIRQMLAEIGVDSINGSLNKSNFPLRKHCAHGLAYT